MSVVLVREIYSPKASRVDSICIGKGRRQVPGYGMSSGANSGTTLGKYGLSGYTHYVHSWLGYQLVSISVSKR